MKYMQEHKMWYTIYITTVIIIIVFTALQYNAEYTI